MLQCVILLVGCGGADLQAALSLRILLAHDPLLLSPLLLLPSGLSSLLALIVGLLQEVLLHTGTVLIRLLFSLEDRYREKEGEQGDAVMDERKTVDKKIYNN